MKVWIDIETIKEWKEKLDPYWFSSDGEEDYNNEGVIDVCKDLADILKTKDQE